MLAWEERRAVTGDHFAALEVVSHYKAIAGKLPTFPRRDDDADDEQ